MSDSDFSSLPDSPQIEQVFLDGNQGYVPYVRARRDFSEDGSADRVFLRGFIKKSYWDLARTPASPARSRDHVDDDEEEKEEDESPTKRVRLSKKPHGALDTPTTEHLKNCILLEIRPNHFTYSHFSTHSYTVDKNLVFASSPHLTQIAQARPAGATSPYYASIWFPESHTLHLDTYLTWLHTGHLPPSFPSTPSQPSQLSSPKSPVKRVKPPPAIKDLTDTYLFASHLGDVDFTDSVMDALISALDAPASIPVWEPFFRSLYLALWDAETATQSSAKLLVALACQWGAGWNWKTLIVAQMKRERCAGLGEEFQWYRQGEQVGQAGYSVEFVLCVLDVVMKSRGSGEGGGLESGDIGARNLVKVCLGNRCVFHEHADYGRGCYFHEREGST